MPQLYTWTKSNCVSFKLSIVHVAVTDLLASNVIVFFLKVFCSVVEFDQPGVVFDWSLVEMT